MEIPKFVSLCMVLFELVQPGSSGFVLQSQAEKNLVLGRLETAGIHPDDLALIEANIDQLSVEHLTEIERFILDPDVIADDSWFDVSGYTGWDDYNYYRPIGDTVVSILARRDLFLDAARQLNNPALTNMSPEALAALAFSQVYVEEKWDHEVPWDGDPNDVFNWVHPDIINNPNIISFMRGDFLYRARVEYWWATYWSFPLSVARRVGIGRGTDMDEALRGMQPPNPNLPRLSGYSYPLGNQLFLQTAETVYWYVDYLKYGEQRYGPFESQPLDTRIRFPDSSGAITASPLSPITANLFLPSDPAFSDYPELWELFNAPFGAELRRELTHPEKAAFWNVMRFLHAGARQREGGASPEHPENGQPAVIALRYEQRTPIPVGRSEHEISAFALLTTVYSDSILLDFTNWDTNGEALIHTPSDTSRSDGLHRQVSERNKAIRVIEQMGNEIFYPNATHISGSRGLGFNLITQYEDPVGGEFLPYTTFEARALTMALVTESTDYGIEDSRMTLCNSPLLRLGYEEYLYQASLEEDNNSPDWGTVVGQLCS